MESVNFEFMLKEFDLSLLPIAPELLQQDENLLRTTIREYLNATYARLGGDVRISSYDDYIQVQWIPVKMSSDWQEALELAVALLQKGAYGAAEPVLRGLERLKPDSADVLYNYGMMLSDQGRLDEAVEKLKHATKQAPDNGNAWVALGVALDRQGKPKAAIVVLEKAIEAEPENGYALRNLGGLMAREDPAGALPYLARAAALLPDDQQARYGYGLCLMQTGDDHEADSVLTEAIELDSFSALAELCRTARTEMAHKKMRSQSGSGVQMDVTMYCLAALQKFNEMGSKAAQLVTAEIAMLGRDGLHINDSAKKYRLKTLHGEFSGRQLLAYMYVGLKQIAPELDAGVDFSKEYESALSLFTAEPRKDTGNAG